eukprot:730020-Prorocentrum_minimum.AAC.1
MAPSGGGCIGVPTRPECPWDPRGGIRPPPEAPKPNSEFPAPDGKFPAPDSKLPAPASERTPCRRQALASEFSTSK